MSGYVEEYEVANEGYIGVTVITETVPTTFPTTMADLKEDSAFSDRDIAPGSIIKVINSGGLSLYMLSDQGNWFAF